MRRRRWRRGQLFPYAHMCFIFILFLTCCYFWILNACYRLLSAAAAPLCVSVGRARGQAGRNCGGGVLESRQQWRAQGIGPKEAATRASAHFMLRTSDAHLADAREDRLQRALQENRQLKHELQELREKLKVVQVKFYKLTKDLKRVSPEMLQQLDGITATTLPTLRPASSGDIRAHSLRLPGAKKSTRRGFATSLPHVDAIKTEPTHAEMESKELQHCREALQQAQLEIASLRAGAPQTTALAENTTCTVTPVLPSALPPAVCLVLDQLRQDIARVTAERDQVSAECDALREQFARTRAEFESAHLLQRQQRSFEKHSFDVLNERAATAESARHHSELEYQKIIDALTREKDALALKLRLSEQENSERLKELSSVDPTVLIQLQNEAHDKSKQITVLTSRMQWAQQQAETLKSECSRLVEELKRFQSIHSETKKQLFEAEHDKSLLQVRCARLEELEATLRRKSEELIHMEQELLRTTGTLQSCNQETEEAVRRELSSRIADLQEMRDNAELRRREKESQLLSAQHQLAELRRQLELARGDAAMYREQLQKAEMERSELTTRAALAGRAVEDLGDEHVQRALTVAAMRRTSSRRLGEAGEAEEALDMWDALKWDENWEADQLREALASAALDMELANTRCSQMSTQLEQSRSLLQQISQERDALLDENIEMRRRLSHVQTVFAKQQLEAYCASKARGVDSAHARSGLISFHIQDVECDEVLLRSLGIGEAAGAAVNFFFTLDGLRSYDTMLSPTFYSLYEPLDIRFRYDHLDRDEVTVDAIRNTTFVFQLHQVKGTTNKIVAMAEVPGVALLSCRELTVSERIQMLNGDGEPAGAITVEMCASHLMLPVLLDRPLGSTLFTADALRAVLLSLRSVVALRVQVFRANGLLGTPVPQPYVFYTTSAPVGLSCVRDTVVRPSSKPFTTDPVFDADPVDHRLVVDRELVEFIAGGAVVFILFDEQAKDVQANLGVAEVPLRALLESPQAVVRTTEALHPQGTISVGLSWVCRA
ncbi:hypothetical protein TCDM_02988 [Trypanosoma cruzi Dm28c]|uniref:C2 domain-containing protein n=1 Tax=Trypanosoma cruzi Dm28c TaxID=1416333 RepID=V5BPY2_TRYCR|nr:hypothetical protein TCDM_02988 [Trypanosoma cruzi Dm28c]